MAVSAKAKLDKTWARPCSYFAATEPPGKLGTAVIDVRQGSFLLGPRT